ncbi:hypothetical protein [Thalassomonas sp. M1454]|uniref:hypothetical protein n=1 Tax=Thalassomonas sp. M1454 TaxID=2594477 RepID=UPI00117DDD49|nr:hypothetical protein [Thalassomonas sp. M1454]TRX55162.1 hypothetical protein FNN08_11270 [Thalassomonas sp. M1454]
MSYPISHSIISEEEIESHVLELQKRFERIGKNLFQTDYSCIENSYPERSISLAVRHTKLGIFGKLIEGDFLPDDFNDIQELAELERTLFPDLPPLLQTIMHAGDGRLAIMLHEKVSIESVYGITHLDEFIPDCFFLHDFLTLDSMAALADMSVQAIRNAMSNSMPKLNTVKLDGRIVVPVAEATEWLKKRQNFKPTIDTTNDRAEHILVPVAKDGSFFNIDCKNKSGDYTIGPKDNAIKVTDFNDALHQLKEMPLARWRRPNANGKFGLVSAVEWKLKSIDEVKLS